MGVMRRAGKGVGDFIGGVMDGIQGGAAAKAQAPRAVSLLSGEDRYGSGANLAVTYNQQDLYQRLAWVSTAISVVAQLAAAGTFNVYAMDGEERRDLPNHPYELLHRSPNPFWTGIEFWRAFFSFEYLTGSGYAWLKRPSETVPPSEMWIIPSHKILPIPDGRLGIASYKYEPGGGLPPTFLEPWEILCSREFHPLSTYSGLSRISQLATIAEGDMAMQRHNTSYFRDQGGKMPGVLTFADQVPDDQWVEIERDVKNHDKSGRILLLRNTGQGVNWVSTAMSRKDMEFLAGRTANKEEIYEWLAPGLYSWLAVNSTEANSKSGRDAFYEASVWPRHVSLAEKITAHILPAYGNNLIGAFEDVRPRDGEQKLREQQAYERTHTIDQVNKKFYGEDPLPGGLGERLVRDGSMESLGAQEASPAPLAAGKVAASSPEAEREREQFKRYAMKRLQEGKPEKVADFRFEHLGEDEQTALKAQLLGGEWSLKQKLQSLIDEVRENV
ncbi:MAG: phage portal protein [Anaerolineales bacterium]|nr:phage portal protein [Anaerolineales bacterium]